jgi:malate/lactate dehydrogenase
MDKETAHKLMWNFVTAGIARSVRYASLSMYYDDRTMAYIEPKDIEGRTFDAFRYMNMAGTFDIYKQMFQTTYGMATGSLDMDEAIFNGFNNPWLPPSVNYVGRGAKLAEDLVTGKPLDQQLSSIRKFAPLGTIAPSNGLFGILKEITED